MVNLSFSIYDLEYFLLILTRVSCFMFLAPFFSMTNTPTRIRLGLSIFTSVLLYQVLTPSEVVVADSIFSYSLLVIKEAITGLLLGFSVNICMTIVNFAGSIADMETGLSMANLIDPTTRENSSITGVYYQYIIMLLMIVTGMYRFLLQAIADTFKLIPVNGAVFRSENLLENMVLFLTDYVIIGFRIVLPIFCVMLLLNAILGVMAKVSPQMNMFAVGMQLKILVGLSVLFLTTSLLPGAADFIFQEMKKMMTIFTESMM